MSTNTIAHSEVRKKKFLLLLPLLFLPFAALLFFALGGGQPATDEQPQEAGLNTQLPGASVDRPRQEDKMSIYQLAARDSAKAREAEELDRTAIGGIQVPPGIVESPFAAGGAAAHNDPDNIPADQQVEDLNRKLEVLQQMINQSQAAPPTNPAQLPVAAGQAGATAAHADQAAQQLQQLSQMVAASGPERTGEDPELLRMNNMLQTIVDIQHPDLVRQRLKEQSTATRGILYPVSGTPQQPRGDYFGAPATPVTDSATRLTRGFFGNEPAADTGDSDIRSKGIEAVVHDSQELVSGATVKIRLTQDAYINGQLLRAGSFLFGQCSLTGERLAVAVTSIRLGTFLFPVSLQVFDFDGNAGIRIPGSITRDASKQASDQAIQSAAIGTLDPSLGAQAAAAGLETAKNLLSRKVRMVRVTVKAGYPVLLHSGQ